MNAHGFNFFFIGSTYINEYIVHAGRDISLFAGAGVDGRPTKYAFYRALVGMNGHPHGWGYQMIASPVSDHTDVTLFGDVVDKPGDFICMTFDDDFVFFSRIDNSIRSTVIVKVPLINVGLEVFQPYFLPFPLKTGRRSIVEVFV